MYYEHSNVIIDKNELYDCFIKKSDELIERLDFYFNLTNCLFLNYRLQSWKNEFTFTLLVHLLFCNRSPNSNEVQSRLCSQFFFDILK